MKRLALFAITCLTLLGALAPATSAFADAHGDKFKQDCKSGARKC